MGRRRTSIRRRAADGCRDRGGDPRARAGSAGGGSHERAAARQGGRVLPRLLAAGEIWRVRVGRGMEASTAARTTAGCGWSCSGA